MKTIVIYHSQTGFTKRYAQWIADATGDDCVTLSEAKKKSMDTYGTIVFGSWVCAGNIRKLGWFKRHMEQWTDKKLIVFCVGASSIAHSEIELVLKQNFTKAERKKADVFYCPGGFHYEKLPTPSKLMIKVFIKMLKAKRDRTTADEEMLKMISSSYDISDKKYIEPILQCLKK